MGLSWGALGALLGPSWGSFGGSWGPLGALFGGLGGLFGPSWRPRLKKTGGFQFPSPPRRLKKGVLGPSWAALGALLGALGAVLGPSWAPLGALLGHLGAILRPQEPIGSEKARRQKTLIFLRFWSDLGLSGASLGGSVATSSRLGAVLEHLVGMLGGILSHRELS